MKTLPIIPVAADFAANQEGSRRGPQALKQSHILAGLSSEGLRVDWQKAIAQPDTIDDKTAAVAVISRALAAEAEQYVRQGEPFLVFGGDHAYALGTWQGVLSAAGQVGLIWIDAHLDAHTFETTSTGNIHGMPLAALLGRGDAQLTSLSERSLQPEHVVVIGARSFEWPEQNLLKELGVTVFYMDEVQRQGLNTVLDKAYQIVQQAPGGFGISIDLDGLDPKYTPGVNTCEKEGLSLPELCQGLQSIAADKKFLGAEIMEYNPDQDTGLLTQQSIYELVKSLFGGASR